MTSYTIHIPDQDGVPLCDSACAGADAALAEG